MPKPSPAVMSKPPQQIKHGFLIGKILWILSFSAVLGALSFIVVVVRRPSGPLGPWAPWPLELFLGPWDPWALGPLGPVAAEVPWAPPWPRGLARVKYYVKNGF